MAKVILPTPDVLNLNDGDGADPDGEDDDGNVPTMMARVISPLLVSSTAPPAMLPPILSGTSQRVFIVCKC